MNLLNHFASRLPDSLAGFIAVRHVGRTEPFVDLESLRATEHECETNLREFHDLPAVIMRAEIRLVPHSVVMHDHQRAAIEAKVNQKTPGQQALFSDY